MRYTKEAQKTRQKLGVIDSRMSINRKSNVMTCDNDTPTKKRGVNHVAEKKTNKTALPEIPTDLHVIPSVSTKNVKDNLAIEELKKVGVIWVTNVIESEDKIKPTIGSTPGNFLFEIRGDTQMFTIGATKLQELSNRLDMLPFVQPDSNVENIIKTNSAWNNRYKIACKRKSNDDLEKAE